MRYLEVKLMVELGEQTDFLDPHFCSRLGKLLWIGGCPLFPPSGFGVSEVGNVQQSGVCVAW